MIKTKIYPFLLMFTLAWPVLCEAQIKPGATINVEKFGAKNNGGDVVPALRQALEYCRKINAKKMIFTKGRYDFWPDRAKWQYIFSSNNDEGLKRITFLLEAFKNFEIDGQGSQFIFHGFISPFILINSTNIRLCNFSVDWARTFDSEGRIINVDEAGMEVSFSDEYPYRIENGVLTFYGEEKTIYTYGSLLEFDFLKKETAYMASDYPTGSKLPAKELSKGRVRLLYPGIKGKAGNILVFGAGQRSCSAVTISDSRDIHIQNVTIYHCGGMGAIAQRSRNIELNQVNVSLKPGSDRMISATADATHFVNCTGKIVMSNCLFENQLDDATNIHGIYVQVTKKLSPDEVEVKLKHEQQLGFDFIKPGDRMEFVHSLSLVTYREAIVKAVKRINKEYTHVVFTTPLLGEMLVGQDIIASVNGYPDVDIHDCIIRNNRARGVLLGTRGKVLIRSSVFHTPGAAILFEGDGRYWFEQAGVRNVTITGNTFENCNFGVWGNAVIQVGSGVDKAYRSISRYNRNITIKKNTFRIFDSRILNMYSAEHIFLKIITLK